MSGLLTPLLGTSGYQSFRTVQVPNSRVALYTLSIRYPGNAKKPYLVYTFPLSPSSIKKLYTAMSTVYDTAGTAMNQGVQRQIDVYGASPVTFIIEGTTGWTRHSNDGYLATGLQSMQNLENMMGEYAQLNTAQMQAGLPLYTMEFYDFFTNDFWQVEPVGVQGISQDAGAPLWQRFKFTLPGIQRVSAPLVGGVSDLIGQLFNAAAAPAMASAQSAITSTLSAYGI